MPDQWSNLPRYADGFPSVLSTGPVRVRGEIMRPIHLSDHCQIVATFHVEYGYGSGSFRRTAQNA